MSFKIWRLNIELLGKSAGAISFWWDSPKPYRGRHDWCLHLGVYRKYWTWGYESDWYDGPIDHWGLGPLFLLVML